MTSPKESKVASPAVAVGCRSELPKSAQCLPKSVLDATKSAQREPKSARGVLTEYRIAIGVAATVVAVVALLLSLGVSAVGLGLCASVALVCILI
jgi:flagellar motor component MotA